MFLLRNILVLSLWLMINFREGEGSCYQFGHACFGAHGKRNEPADSQKIQTQDPDPDQNEESGIPFGTLDAQPNSELFSNYVKAWMDRINREMKTRRLTNQQSPLIYYNHPWDSII